MKRILLFMFLLIATIGYSQIITPTYIIGWENNTVIGSTANNWGYLDAYQSYSYTIITDAGAREGSRYARIEVRSGDDPTGPAGTERAEVYGPRGADNSTIKENEGSGVIRYDFSVKFDASWTNFATNDFAIFFQIKAPAGVATNPMISFSATDSIRMKLLSGDQLTAVRTTHSLSNGTLNKGNWIDFRITINYRKSATGYIEVERRDEGQENFTTVLDLRDVSTLCYNSTVNGGVVGDHYLKLGLYRNAQTFTSILYNDGFIRYTLSYNNVLFNAGSPIYYNDKQVIY